MEVQQSLGLVVSFCLGAAATYVFTYETAEVDKPTVKVSDVQVVEETRPNISLPPATLRTVDASQTVKRLQAELEQLQLEHDDLKRRSLTLAEQVDHKTKTNAKLSEELIQVRNEKAQAEYELGLLADSDITDEQMRALVEEPFSGFLTSFKGEQRDKVYEFYNQPKDLGWGYQMQLNISDFISTHAEEAGVELVGVSCKVNQCEFRVIEKNPADNAYHVIINEMQKQEWWQASSFHSMSSNMPDNTGSKIFSYVSFNNS